MTDKSQDLKLCRCVDLHLTQEKMAELLGVSLRTYARWESSGPPDRVMKHVDLLIRPAISIYPAPAPPANPPA